MPVNEQVVAGAPAVPLVLRASLLFAAMKALLVIARKDYHLLGVFFESTGKTLWMVSTDGHRLAVWEHRLEEPGPRGKWFVPRPFIEWLVKTLSQLRFLERRGFLAPDNDNPMGQLLPHGPAPRREGSFDPSVSIDFGALTATTALGSIRFALSADDFPAWRRVIPDWGAVRNQKEVDGIPVPWLDADYVEDALRSFRHAASMSHVSDLPIVVIPAVGSSRPGTYHTNPVVIRSTAAPWFTYLLMPMRPAMPSDLWEPLEEFE